MNRTQFLLSTSLLGCVVATQPVFAQDAAAQATASPSDSSTGDQALREIVVTAERRTSTAQKTAASISVRSGDEMLRLGRYELKNILEDVPGVVGGAAAMVNTSPGGGTDNPAAGLTIRGVRSNSGAGGSTTSTAAAAAIYVDDVYNGIGGAYDLDRVEVLRGPQGTLYGRSATAGVVAIHATDPQATKLGATGTMEFGNYSLIHVTGALNVPLIQDKLALRVSGNRYERNGYYSAKGGAISSTEFRAKLLWTPTDNFSALLGYAQQYNTAGSGGVSISQPSADEFEFTQTEVAPVGKNDFHQYWGNFNLDLGSVGITYIPAYRDFYQNAILYARTGFFNANQTVYTPTDWFMTHELRVHSNNDDSKLKWQAGFLYYKNALTNVTDLFNLGTQTYLNKASTRKTTIAEGAFAEATYAIAPETRVTAGIRYDHTQVRTSEDYTGPLGTTLSLTGDAGLSKFNNVTYKARLEHDLTSQNLLYGSVSTGFSPGDITVATGANDQPEAQPLSAETLTAYEIGSKNRFFGNRLQVNGAIYYNIYGGYQTSINTTTSNALPANFIRVTLPMKSYGAELEIQARPWENGTFSFNGSYTHARYGELGQYAPYFSTRTVPGVPPFQGSVAYDHRIPIGEASLMLRGAIRFFSAHDTSSISVSWANQGAQPYVHVKSQAVGDLNATLEIGSFSLTGYVRNVTDRRFLPDDWSLASVENGVVSSSRFTLSDPRTYGLVASFKY